MSVSYLFAPQEPTRAQRWLNRWWPSVRLGVDPLHDLRIDDRYAPVSIANWKLIAPVGRRVLARRVMRPLAFTSGKRLSVIIPFRDREQHLQQLLPVLRARLIEQNIAFRIVVVEQEAGGLFNRGRLLNVGMHHAADASDYYCLHDVDVLPSVANYRCPSQPLRVAHKVLDAAGERVHTDYYFSGAVSIRKEQALAVNGFSNEYWGWGKEDDDFFFRLLLAGFLCYYDIYGTFHELPNPRHQQVNRGAGAPAYVRYNRNRRSRLLRGLDDPANDGLTTLRYDIIERAEAAGYERIKVRW